MSEGIWIAIIIAVTILLVLWIYRDRLRRFGLDLSPRRLRTNLEANQNPADPSAGNGSHRSLINILRNLMVGWDNSIEVNGRPVDNANVNGNLQVGGKQRIRAGEKPAAPAEEAPTAEKGDEQ